MSARELAGVSSFKPPGIVGHGNHPHRGSPSVNIVGVFQSGEPRLPSNALKLASVTLQPSFIDGYAIVHERVLGIFDFSSPDQGLKEWKISSHEVFVGVLNDKECCAGCLIAVVAAIEPPVYGRDRAELRYILKVNLMHEP